MADRSRTRLTLAFLALLVLQLTGVVDVAVSHLPQPLRQLAQDVGITPQPVQAAGRYGPTGGNLLAGNTLAITTVGTTGNTGSWRGTLAHDGWWWAASSTAAAGLNQILYVDNVALNNANKMVISLTASSGSASLQRYYQICDWVSNNKVDVGEDSECRGGGWRTLHKVDAGFKGRQAIAEAQTRNFVWHIYDGYFNDNTINAGTTHEPMSTPLSNFVSSTGRVSIRAYAPAGVATTHLINWLSVDLVVDPVYFPAEATVISGTQTGESSYVLAQSPPTLISATGGTTGSDNAYLRVSGTAGSIADFFVRFKNVRTYTGANAIAVVAEYSCSAVGINHRPKVFNFFENAWEDLTTTSIACSATDAVGQFGFTTSSLWKYIRDGEVRVGWYGLANGTQDIRLDYIYIVVGSTVADPSRCEISYGTGVDTQCDRMNDLDSTLASTTGWMAGSEADSNTFSHDYYAYDNDADAVANEHNVAAHVIFDARVPSHATLAGLAYSVRALPASAHVSLQPQFKDWNGTNPTAFGGWTNFGAIASATSTYDYTDSIWDGYFVTSSNNYIVNYDDTIHVRFRSAASTLLVSFTRVFDWAMVSLRWIEEDAPRRTQRFDYAPTNGRLRVGNETNRRAAGSSGNVGSWRGTLGAEANDGFNWTVAATGSGINQQLDFDGVTLKGANKMVIQVYASSGSASLVRYYQICDWATTTAVDSAADQDCSGGWRTLNKLTGGNRTGMADATRRTYTWHIYEGYWSSGTPNATATTNTIVSSTLSYFVSSTNGTVRIRAFSTSTTNTTHMFNYATLMVVVDPVYHPSGLNVVTGQSTGLSNYVNAANPPSLVSGSNANGSDNNYAQASGTASVTTEYYMVFRGVKTYEGMNAILAVAESGCSTTGISYKFRIYNFVSPGWEDLTANIACSATDQAFQMSKSNVTVSNYISNGEVRIGVLGSANGTQNIRLDYIYIILGTVNGDSAGCRIDYGTNSSGDCTNTRAIDTSSAVSQWSVASAVESANMGSDYFALAGDSDATAEHMDSVHVPFTLTVATGTVPAGWILASRHRSGGTGKTLQGQLRDWSGANRAASGGFINIGTTAAATTTYTYQDVFNTNYLYLTPEDFVDVDSSSTAMRFRTSAATYTGTQTTSDFDFIMVSYRWVEDPNSTDITLTLDDTTWAMDPVTAGGGEVEPAFNAALDSQNGTGMSLYIKRNDANSTMDLISDPTQDIADLTEWIAPGVTTTAGNAQSYPGTGLGFRVGEGSTDAALFSADWWGTDISPLYAGVPTTSQAVAVSSIPGTMGAKLFFRLAVPITQAAGDYDGTMTLTASINP